jgi:hypothetical protein
MARDEHDREDLLREATAYVDRAEFSIPGFASPVFIGFRRNGAASIYFDPDCVYHFNSAGKLRRAYRDGLLFKAEEGQLISMARRRDANETSLMARRQSVDETRAFLEEMKASIARLKAVFAARQAAASGQVTSSPTAARGQTAVGRIELWLTEAPHDFAVAQSPHAH